MEASTANLSPQHPLELCLDNLKDEIVNVLQNEKSYKDKIEKLETELNVYKRAFADLDTDLQTAKRAQIETEELNEKLQAECLAFKKQDKGHRIVMLLDGDGTIFSPQFIEKGQKGGHAAAQRLSDEVFQFISAEYGPRSLHLWVYVFFNKRGLVDALRRAGFMAAAAISKFDDFVMGFNQASERFLMVDVGTTKEAADAKLKVYLEDEIRLPETYKVVFGGCHDNGYVANLHSQITAGYKEKLVLLKSYTEVAGGIAALGLPTVAIPGLFMPQKIGEGVVFSSPGPKASKDLPSPALSGNVNLGPSQTSPAATLRPLDPSKPVSQQKLCTLHYMKNECKSGKSCQYHHDFALTDTQRDDLAKVAKKTPCPTALAGGDCAWGNACPFGHICPFMPKCFFYKKGTCKFRQANMHVSPAG